jgi:hypothetical protein
VPVAAYPPGFDPPDRSRSVTRLSEAGAKDTLIKKEKKLMQS